jgi:hypothetical protein
MGTTARTILLALSVGLASGAKAEVDRNSANYLLPACKAFVDGHSSEGASLVAQGYCGGLVSGVALIMGDSGLPYACAHIPDGVTTGQQVRVVIRYLEQRPNRLHEPFKELAVEALANAWPCRDAKVMPR